MKKLKKRKQKRSQMKNKRKININIEKRRKAGIVMERRSMQTFDCSNTPKTTMIILCYIHMRFCLYYFL
jgi:hypothetical protein